MPDPPASRDLPDLSPAVFAGECHRCGNRYGALYIRRASGANQRLCLHCVQLEATGKVHTGRGGGRRWGRDAERPYNQPSPYRMHGNKPRSCVECGSPAIPMYLFYGHSFQACGWAHAGSWMDWVMEQILEAEPSPEDLEYVRQSLGLKGGSL